MLQDTWEEDFLNTLNEKHYLAFYPDVREEQITALQHWTLSGNLECRLPSLSYFYNKYPTFSVEKYLQTNPDIREKLLQEEHNDAYAIFMRAVAHYWSHGRHEGRYIEH